jgi:hypothetical protein
MSASYSKRHGAGRRVLVAGAILGCAALAFIVWYRMHFAMDPAQSFEVTGAASAGRVLIATQGSEFKNALTAGLVEHLKHRAAVVKVIDVSALDGIDEGEWDAMVVIHTWEMREPPLAVRTFVDRTRAPQKLVVLTTSGAGDFELPGVDAISTASTMTDVVARTNDVARRVDAILDAKSSSSSAP